MPEPAETVFFANEAGQVLAHAAGYGMLRYHAGRRQPADLPALLTQLGGLLLTRSWSGFLADNRLMSPFNQTEKDWFMANWLGGGVARPARLTGAVVLPQDVVARLSFLQMYATAGSSGISYHTFTELAEAQRYLTASLPAT